MSRDLKVFLVSSALLFSIYLTVIACLMIVLILTQDLRLQGALIVTGIAAAYEIVTSLFAVRKERKRRVAEDAGAGVPMAAAMRQASGQDFTVAVKKSIRRRVLPGLASALSVTGVVLFLLHFNPGRPIFWIAIILFLFSTQLALLHLHFSHGHPEIKVQRLFLLHAFQSVVFALLLFIFLTRTAALVLSGIVLALAIVNFVFYNRS